MHGCVCVCTHETHTHSIWYGKKDQNTSEKEIDGTFEDFHTHTHTDTFVTLTLAGWRQHKNGQQSTTHATTSNSSSSSFSTKSFTHTKREKKQCCREIKTKMRASSPAIGGVRARWLTKSNRKGHIELERKENCWNNKNRISMVEKRRWKIQWPCKMCVMCT